MFKKLFKSLILSASLLFAATASAQVTPFSPPQTVQGNINGSYGITKPVAMGSQLIVNLVQYGGDPPPQPKWSYSRYPKYRIPSSRIPL